MTLESIETLRRTFDQTTAHYALEAACDEIEREVAERYMELPVDADGEPIKPGDTITWCDWDEPKRIEIINYGGEGEWWLFAEDGNECDSVKNCRHYRKPTVEDVLREFTAELLREEELYGDKHREEVTAKYADKLREAVRDE